MPSSVLDRRIPTHPDFHILPPFSPRLWGEKGGTQCSCVQQMKGKRCVNAIWVLPWLKRSTYVRKGMYKAGQENMDLLWLGSL